MIVKTNAGPINFDFRFVASLDFSSQGWMLLLFSLLGVDHSYVFGIKVVAVTGC